MQDTPAAHGKQAGFSDVLLFGYRYSGCFSLIFFTPNKTTRQKNDKSFLYHRIQRIGTVAVVFPPAHCPHVQQQQHFNLANPFARIRSARHFVHRGVNLASSRRRPMLSIGQSAHSTAGIMGGTRSHLGSRLVAWR
jgi:hypothetical protein